MIRFSPAFPHLHSCTRTFVQFDYAFWSQTSHITAKWIEMTQYKTALDRELVLLSVVDALLRYHRFNTCYDANGKTPTQAHFSRIIAGVAAVGTDVREKAAAATI